MMMMMFPDPRHNIHSIRCMRACSPPRKGGEELTDRQNEVTPLCSKQKKRVYSTRSAPSALTEREPIEEQRRSRMNCKRDVCFRAPLECPPKPTEASGPISLEKFLVGSPGPMTDGEVPPFPTPSASTGDVLGCSPEGGSPLTSLRDQLNGKHVSHLRQPYRIFSAVVHLFSGILVLT